jgi:hypothetical protein
MHPVLVMVVAAMVAAMVMAVVSHCISLKCGLCWSFSCQFQT